MKGAYGLDEIHISTNLKLLQNTVDIFRGMRARYLAVRHST